MKIRKVKEKVYITFTSGEYRGKSFEKVEEGKFINYLNGTIDDIGFYGNYETNIGYDLVLFGNSYTEDLLKYVEQKLQQKLSIHMNELEYPFENTDEIGIPYLTKKNKDELDMILKEAILDTTGVKNIVSYTSNQEGRSYKYEFVVKTMEGGELRGGNR